MSDDEKPNAADDVKKAFGLLFRAAKTAVEQMPTKKLEDVVTQGAKEVGRAIENVADTIDKEVFGGAAGRAAAKVTKSDVPPHAPEPPADDAAPDAPPEQKTRVSDPGGEPPKT